MALDYDLQALIGLSKTTINWQKLSLFAQLNQKGISLQLPLYLIYGPYIPKDIDHL